MKTKIKKLESKKKKKKKKIQQKKKGGIKKKKKAQKGGGGGGDLTFSIFTAVKVYAETSFESWVQFWHYSTAPH